MKLHPGRGHSLRDDVLLGPLDPAIADEIAAEAANAAKACR